MRRHTRGRGIDVRATSHARVACDVTHVRRVTRVRIVKRRTRRTRDDIAHDVSRVRDDVTRVTRDADATLARIDRVTRA
jgi:hypothetical protein